MPGGDGTTKERFPEPRTQKPSIKPEPVSRSRTYFTSEIDKKRPPKPLKGKFPEYADRSARLASFQGWPGRIVHQEPESLARCGFFYIGSADRVRCFCCGTTLRDWTSADDPYVEHVTWAPDCPFINNLSPPLLPALPRRGDKASNLCSSRLDDYHERNLGGGDACSRQKCDFKVDEDGRKSRYGRRDVPRAQSGQVRTWDRGDVRNRGYLKMLHHQGSRSPDMDCQAIVYDFGDDPQDQEDLRTTRDQGSSRLGQDSSRATGSQGWCPLDQNGHHSTSSSQESRHQDSDSSRTSWSSSWCSSGNSWTCSPRERDSEALEDAAVGRVPPAMMDSPQVLAVLGMGFPREAVETVLQMRLLCCGKAYSSAVDLYKDVELFVKPPSVHACLT